MKIKIYNFFVTLGVYVLIVFFYFNTLLNQVLPGYILASLIFLAFICIIIGCSKCQMKYVKKRKRMYGWILLGMMALVTNVEFKHGVYTGYFIWVIYLLSAFCLTGIYGWQSKVIKCIGRLGLVHVIATIVLFIIPSLYSIMYKIYGYYPEGTINGTKGYTAALTNHYSLNSAYIAFALLVYGVDLIVNPSKRGKKNHVLRVLLIVFALILTSKRGMLIFAAVTLIITYFTFNKKKIIKKYFIIMCFGLSLLILYAILRELAPDVLQVLFGRFMIKTNVSISNGRMDILWPLAISIFNSNKLFGIGWLGYQYQYHNFIFDGTSQYELLSPHNIYLQILCENGIVGFALLMFIIVFSIRFFLKNRQMCADEKSYYYMAFSFSVFILFIIYGLTGCCMYDQTFYCFIIVFAIGYSVNLRINNARNEK